VALGGVWGFGVGSVDASGDHAAGRGGERAHARPNSPAGLMNNTTAAIK